MGERRGGEGGIKCGGGGEGKEGGDREERRRKGGEGRQDYEKGLTGLGERISRNNPNTRKNIGSVHNRAERNAASSLVGAWKCNFRKL